MVLVSYRLYYIYRTLQTNGMSFWACSRHTVWSKNSCGLARVVFQEPPKPFATLKGACTLCVLADRRKEQHVTLALVIPLMMKMRHILRERMAQRPFPKQDEPRQALLLDGSHPALRVGVQIRRPRRQGHPLDPGSVNYVLKGGAVFPVSVMDEVLPRSQEAPLFHGDIAGDLHHPGLIGMRCHPRDMHFPCAEPDKEQDVIRHQPTQRPDLGGEEVGRDEDVEMRADELLPRRGGLALWRRGETMTLQDVAHGLITDGVAQIGQCPHNAIVAPRTVLVRHANDQRLQLLVNGGSPWALPVFGAIKLLGHELTVPTKNRVGLDDRGHLLQGLLAEFLADCGQGFAFTVTQPDAPLDLVAEDAIFRDQVLIAQQQFLIDCPRDIRQQGLPIHASVPLHCFLAHGR